MVKLHYPEMETLEDLVYYTQLNQADALKFGIEHYRRLKGRCWGTLIWQINDCWPVQSWAMIDSELQHKAVFYASRAFFAPVLLSLHISPLPSEERAVPGEGLGVRARHVQVHVVNDTLGPVQGAVSVALVVLRWRSPWPSRPLTSVCTATTRRELLGTLSLVPPPQVIENSTYVVASLTGPNDDVIARNLILLGEPAELELASPGLAVDFEEHDEETIAVTVAAKTFAASVWLYVDPEDAPNPPEFSDNFFHLEAGETRTRAPAQNGRHPRRRRPPQLLRVRRLFGEE